MIQLRDLAARLRVIFDKRSADQAETQAKGSMDRLRSAAMKAGAAIAAAFTVQKIVAFGRESVRAAMEADAVWNRLSGTLRTVGIEFAAVEKDVRAAARAMQDVTTVGDEDFAAILSDLTSISRDYSASLRNVQVVADLAAAKQLDFRTAAQLVGRAMVGQTQTLTRYGIVVAEGADAVEVMRAQFAGMAENEIKSNAGQLKQLNNEWGDFKEAIGTAMLEAGEGTSVLQTLIGMVKGATIYVEQNAGAFRLMGKAVLGLLTPLRGLALLVEDLGDLFAGLANGGLWLVQAAAARAAEGFAFLLDAGAKVDEWLGKGEGAKRAREHAAALREWADEIRQAAAISKAAAAGNFSGIAAPSGRRGTRTASGSAGGTAGGGAATGSGGSATPALGAAPNPGAPGLAPIGGGMRTVGTDVQPRDDMAEWTRRQEEFAAGWVDANQEIVSATYSASRDMERAWGDAFDQLLMEGQGLGEFMGTLAQGIGAALLGGVAEYAAGKQRMALAEVIQETALGIGAAAWGNGPKAAAHFKSAGTHAMAAVAWAALAGGAGSAAGAVRGGGGGGGARGTAARDVGANQVGRAEKAGAEVHIYIDPLDPTNPAYQRNIIDTEQRARQRYGEGARIYTHRRTG